jgi:O-antigen/teichoic acid export membrane protein
MINSVRIRKLLFDGSIRGDALQIYIIQFLALGIALVGSVIVARTLGPANKGVFDLFNLINSFIVELGFLGFGSGLLYHLANKGRPLHEVHGTGLLFSLVIGLMTAAVGWFGLKLWKLIFPGLNSWIVLLSFFIAPFLYYRLTWSNIMTGINQAVATYKVGLAFSVISLIAVVILWQLGLLNVQNVIYLTVVLAIFSAVIGFWILYRQEPNLKTSTSLMRKSLQYGSIVYIGNIANILHFKIDQVMLNYWLGTNAVGIYAVSVNWAEMLFVLDSAIISAALYKMSSSSAEESYKLTKKLFKVQLLISGGSGIILAGLANPLILIIYGEAFREAIWPLIILIPGIVAWSAGKVLSQYLSFNQGKFWLATSFAIVGIAVNIGLNFPLIKLLGIKGAAIASALSYCVVILLTIVTFERMGRFD